MSRRRETDDRDNEDEEFIDFNPERAFDSDVPVEEDNTEDSEEGSHQIGTNDLAASILAYILRNRCGHLVMLITQDLICRT